MSAAPLMIAVLLIVTVCLTGAEGQIITAEPGDTVTLRCEAPEKDKPVSVLLWTRTDLESGYVYLYRDKKEDPEAQHPSFKNRVYLLDQQMKDGNMSLVLKNVMEEDEGTYQCKVVQGGTDRQKRDVTETEPIRTIYLHVSSSGNKEEQGGNKESRGGHDGRIVGPVVAVIIGIILIGGFLYLKKKRETPLPPGSVPHDEAAGLNQPEPEPQV